MESSNTKNILCFTRNIFRQFGILHNLFFMGVGKAPSFCIHFFSDTDEPTAENDLRVTVVKSETHKRFIPRISVFHWSHFTGEQHETYQLLPFA